ncbi:MAG: DUF2752 domain-containing protein [Chthoniobacterales bacterium]
MHVQWRRLRPGELDIEFIWLAVTLIAAALGVLWLTLELPWPRCVFRMHTGLPCLTCGATRSAVAFLHGDLGLACRSNPLVFTGICGVILFDIYSTAVLSSRGRRLRVSLPKGAGRKMAFTLAGVAGLSNWVYLLLQ